VYLQTQTFLVEVLHFRKTANI